MTIARCGRIALGLVAATTSLIAACTSTVDDVTIDPPTTSAPATTAPSSTALSNTASSSTASSTTVRPTTAPPTTEPPSTVPVAEILPVEGDVLARSTWVEGCPVEPGDLRLLRLPHLDFDGRRVVGEMIVHADVADDVVQVFGDLLAVGYPIERMAVITPEELADPAPDDNTTTSFVCRPVAGGTSWSEHASGLAVDVNPLQNPYERGGVILPPDGAPFLDRTLHHPAMIRADGPVVAAFERIGWTWGGTWTSLTDLHHFSRSGR